MLLKIRECFSSISSNDFDKIINLALVVHNDSNNETDFIIAESINGSICWIKNGNKYTNCEKAYIGNPEAYSVFSQHIDIKLSEQNEYYKDENSIYNYASAIDGAFEKTIQDTRAPKVGGLAVSVLQTEQLFWYQQKTAVHMGPMKLKTGPEPTRIPFGNVMNGSFSVNFLSSERGNDIQALGIHLFMGNIGILWGPGHHLRPLVLKNCSCESLIEHAKKEFNATITGMKIN